MSSRALDDTGQVLALIVERSRPRIESQKITHPPDVEETLRDIDVRSAKCYADIELKSHRLRKLAAFIDEDPATANLTLEEEDSLVSRLEEIRYQTEKKTGSDDS